MESVSFKDLQFSPEQLSNSLSFNGATIEVLKYLPVEDKKDLVQVALQKSYEDGLYNNILLDVYFHLNIVYLYTNLEFDQEDREDEFKLFDKLASSGLMDMILASMNDEEYKYLYDSLEKMVENHMMFKNSAAAVLQSVIQDLPKNAAEAAEIVENWDLSKFQSVQDMMQVANATGMNNNVPVIEAKEEIPAQQSDIAFDDEKVVSFLEEQAKLTDQE